MKKISIYLCIGTLLLSGCGKPEEAKVAVEKQPFYISTSSVDELTTTNTVSKNGRVIGAQAVTVTSQVPGRVKSIAFDNGSQVNVNSTVISLRDTSGTFSFNAQRAKAQLDGARLNYSSTANNLDKAITDTALGMIQAQNQLSSADAGGNGSTALQLQQLDEQIKKAELDYETQLTNNQQTLENFIDTVQNLGKDLELLYTTVTLEADKILGVSDNYKYQNDTFERVLGAKNTLTKRTSIDYLKNLFLLKAQYTNIGSTVNKDTMQNELEKMKSLAKKLQPLLDQMEIVFTFTESSPNNLPASQLAGFVSTVDGLQGQVQGQVSSITQQANSIQSFLSTYKQQEESIRKQVEITKQQVATTKSNLQDSQKNAGLGVESAESNYNSAISSKQTTLASLSNSIEQARIAHNEAQTQLGKFSITSPIQGTIGEILVDEGQEVNSGTPLFTVSSTSEQQVEISLSEEELQFVQVGQDVVIKIDNEEIAGSVQSISTVADQNFTYKTTISLQETVELFGDVVDIMIPVRTPYPIIPVNVVSILSRNEGIVQTWNGKEITPTKVRFGKIRGSNVEIVSDLDRDLVLIISDVSNYNPNKQILIEKE